LHLTTGICLCRGRGQPLFLIPDDAFQPSDWLRRERLVKGVLRAETGGCQVTLRTKDDHLKGLLEEAGKRQSGDGFQWLYTESA